MMDDALTLNSAKQFWQAYLVDDIDRITAILDAIEAFISDANYPSPFKLVVKNAFEFVRKSPDSFTMTTSSKKKGYQAHTPNVIAFTQLFQAIHDFSERTGSPPETLFHDKQDEFRKELQDTYQMFGRMAVQDSDDGKWPDASIADYDLGKLEITSSVERMQAFRPRTSSCG